jgi:hypothetical protein
VRVSPTPHGGTTFSCKPRTSLVSSVGMVVMTAGCWVAFWYLLQAGVPIAPYVVAFFGLLFTVGTAVALFHRASLTVEGSDVTIRHRILGVGPTRRLRADQVTGVRSEVVGEGSAQSWEVKVHTSDGASYGAAAHLPTQREADWTAEQIREAIESLP